MANRLPLSQARSNRAAIGDFFAGRPAARALFAAVERAIAAAGPATIRVTRSQISFRRTRAFAWAWMPDRWLAGVTSPLVLSLALPRRDESVRWKQVVEPTPGSFVHHLELRSVREVSGIVRARLREAWADAGPK